MVMDEPVPRRTPVPRAAVYLLDRTSCPVGADVDHHDDEDAAVDGAVLVTHAFGTLESALFGLSREAEFRGHHVPVGGKVRIVRLEQDAFDQPQRCVLVVWTRTGTDRPGVATGTYRFMDALKAF